MRTETVLLPQSISDKAAIIFSRALGLSEGATESSKSRLMTSAALAAIFSKITGRDPGPNNWQRFGRAAGVGWMRNDMGNAPFLGKEIAKFTLSWVFSC